MATGALRIEVIRSAALTAEDSTRIGILQAVGLEESFPGEAPKVATPAATDERIAFMDPVRRDPNVGRQDPYNVYKPEQWFIGNGHVVARYATGESAGQVAAAIPFSLKNVSGSKAVRTAKLAVPHGRNQYLWFGSPGMDRTIQHTVIQAHNAETLSPLEAMVGAALSRPFAAKQFSSYPYASTQLASESLWRVTLDRLGAKEKSHTMKTPRDWPLAAGVEIRQDYIVGESSIALAGIRRRAEASGRSQGIRPLRKLPLDIQF